MLISCFSRHPAHYVCLSVHASACGRASARVPTPNVYHVPHGFVCRHGTSLYVIADAQENIYIYIYIIV